ncbi:MAG: hypothetical protein IJT98_09240, partial [Prevotella sp.]|nr:hypothetical protein [Prevotella sp.]
MTERLFNQQYNTRRLRHLLVLFTFMSVPIVGWADYYDIAIQYGTDESNFHSVLVTADPNDIGGNPTDILGDGTMSYDQESNVLTLSGVNLTCSYESSAFIYHNGLMDSEQVVTVRLVGSNTVTLGNYSYFFEGKQITFTAADNTASLNIITQEGREIDLFPDGVTTTYNDNLAFFPSTSEIKYSDTYSLWICGIQVTDANASNVLGDQETPTVVFDAETSSLTLNGATLTAPIKIGLPDLTIDIQGTNTITTTENCIQKMDNTNPSITFKSTSTEVGSLSLYGSSGVYDVGYGSFTISDQFAVILKYYDRYYSNTYYFTDGSTTEAMLTPSYGITVGGMQIGEGNADNVTGEGIGDGSVEVGEMVSFNKTTNTLTLTDAEINGEITYSGTSNLTIAFSGTNAVSTSETSAILYGGSESDRAKLTFSSTNGT